MNVLRRTLGLLSFLAVAAAVLVPLAWMPEAPTILRDFCVQRGVAETGAPNLVSAIYLGWRAYDTLGETIVLLLAVTGALYLLGGRE